MKAVEKQFEMTIPRRIGKGCLSEFTPVNQLFILDRFSRMTVINSNPKGAEDLEIITDFILQTKENKHELIREAGDNFFFFFWMALLFHKETLA